MKMENKSLFYIYERLRSEFPEVLAAHHEWLEQSYIAHKRKRVTQKRKRQFVDADTDSILEAPSPLVPLENQGSSSDHDDPAASEEED